MPTKDLTLGELIQHNQEEAAIHYLALIIEQGNSISMKNHKLSVAYDDIIEAVLLSYKVIGLDENRIESEAYKMDQQYRDSKKTKLTLIK